MKGVTSIGVPIFSREKEVLAAITVSSISQRMDGKRRQEIVQLVKKVTRLEGIVSPRRTTRRKALAESPR